MQALDVYHFNKHVWDVQPPFYVIQRKYLLAVETTFCVASGLIKVSIILFYKRLGSNAVSKPFQWVTRVTIAFIVAYSIAFTLVPIFGCQPISAFWDQSDVIKTLQGYQYKCFDEGADVFSAAVISTAQDLITAILPTFIYWNLQIPIRRKVALFIIFATGYGVVAVGALRSYYTWYIFFETYDVTWFTWNSFTWSLVEIHLGAICANAPALKVFFQVVFKPKTWSKGSRSYGDSSGTKSSTTKRMHSLSSHSRMSTWKISQQYRKYGHQIAEPVPGGLMTPDSAPTQRESSIVQAPSSNRGSVDTLTDIELGLLPEGSAPTRNGSVPSIPSSPGDVQALPRLPSPYPEAHLGPPAQPITSSSTEELNRKSQWKSWS